MPALRVQIAQVAHEFTKKKEEQAKKKPLEKDFDEVVTKLDSTVEKHGRGSSFSSFIFLAVAMGACASVYKKMRTYEKKHHL